MSLYEDLSRLASGELPPADAAALEARIATEPEVAAAWAHLQQTLGDLDALPDALPPPTVGFVQPVPTRTGWIAAAFAAAAALLLWVWPPPAQTVLLTAGEQWVDGAVTVLAADQVVRVDGRAKISVEPPVGSARVPARTQDDGDEDMRTIAAALAGAVVTVAVYEGSAWVSGDDATAATIEVAAGNAHTITPTRVERRVEVPAAAAAPGESPQQTIDRLAAELDAARQELAQAEFARAVASGQLAVHQGEPVDWPEDVPEAYTPGPYEEGLAEVLEAFPEAELQEVDCSEYPCLAAIRLTDDIDNQVLGEALKGWVTDALGTDKLSMSMNRSKFGTPTGEADFIIVGAHEGDRGDNVGRRVEHRMDGMVDTLGQQAEEEMAQDQDVER